MKTDLTKQIELAAKRTLVKHSAFDFILDEVGLPDKKIVDLMLYNINKKIWRCYEIKISVSDFHSKNGHNFVGHYNYYIMPMDVYSKVKDEIPDHIGVYIYGRMFEIYKKSKKQGLKFSQEEMLYSFMKRAYHKLQKGNLVK